MDRPIGKLLKLEDHPKFDFVWQETSLDFKNELNLIMTKDFSDICLYQKSLCTTASAMPLNKELQ